MTLSDVAVRRPVLAVVVALILTLIGIAAFTSLPLRELPAIDPPVVSIQTVYTGASAEVIESRITQPIERQISGIQGIDRVNSSSRDGVSNINITFTLKRDLEAAANDVRDRVSRVLSQLPQNALSPQINKADADASPTIVLSFSSRTMSRLEISDYADRYLVQRLSILPGVAQVFVFGDQRYSMRIWLNASALAARGLGVEDVEQALNSQNVQLPAGSIEANAKDYTINVDRSYLKAADFAALPVGKAGAGGYVTRLGDVARVEEGPDERRRMFKANGAEMIGIGITRQSQSNDIEISKGVQAAVAEANKALPAGTKLEVLADYSIFTSEAVKEVYITLGLSLGLVALVNLLFLGSWRAALIPTIVAPICIVCSFIVLAVLGFSINLLTLLALVLSIGLVVDDAIVVVENIQRRVDEGEPPLVAAERGARQVFFAVVATTLVLVSVFAPLMVLPGYIGRLFVELAIAIAAAVLFSALFALTLSPMLASKLLRPATQQGRVARAVDKAVNAVRRSYRHSLDSLIGQRSAALAAGGFVVGLGLCAVLLFAVLPKELVPDEDRGRVDIFVQAPEGAGFDYTVQRTLQVEPMLQAMQGPHGEVARYILQLPRGGQSIYNIGAGSTVLAPWNERKRSATDIAADLNRNFNKITGARVVAAVRGPFQRGGGGGGGGGSNVDIIIAGPEYEPLAKWSEPILKAARANPGLTRVSSDYEPDAPRLIVTVDRDRAGALGVTAAQVGEALDVMFGPKKVTTYIRKGEEYDVLLQTELEHRRTLADLETLYVKSASGAQVPLSNLVKTEVRGDLANRQRVDQLRAITITAQLNPGYTVADAVKFYEDLAAKQPGGVVVKWGGQAKDYKDSGNSVLFAFGFALLVVFLVLAAQFESFVHPAVIMLTVPLAAAGGLFGLLMSGSSINIYSQIGLIILIGIAAKNGILIVEFANQRRDDGLSVREAVIESADLRLRPIVMTSIAAAMGSLPLILQQGPGSGSRHTIGVVIFFGAIFATLVTLFVVPVFYGVFARYTRAPDAAAREIEAYQTGEGA